MLSNSLVFKRKSLLLILFSIFLGVYSLSCSREAFSGQAGMLIEDVRIDRVVLTSGEQAHISFLLTDDANVSLFIYNPDFAAVRTLLSNQSNKAGTLSVAWDGADDSGRPVPDEAYMVGIVATGTDGGKTVYDPTAYSGGKELNLTMETVEVSNGVYNLYYSLSQPARVSLRAGIHQGPLLKTIIDWQPQPPGDYLVTWDGHDDAGRVKVMDVAGALMDIRGFSLPEGTIIVRGNDGDYSAYHRSLRSAGTSGDITRTPYGTSDDVSYESLQAGAEYISFGKFRENVLKRRGQSISPQYLVPRILNISPDFNVYLEADKSTPLADRATAEVSGKVGVFIEVGPESLLSFNESRYEIIVFIDFRRFDEEEQAYSPYTYLLDTNRLENGERWITINLASITGQVSSYSFKLNVNN